MSEETDEREREKGKGKGKGGEEDGSISGQFSMIRYSL